MSVGEQIEARLATRWGQMLIMILLAIGFAILSTLNAEAAGVSVILAMVVSWGLGAAYGRRQVYRKVGRARYEG